MKNSLKMDEHCVLDCVGDLETKTLATLSLENVQGN